MLGGSSGMNFCAILYPSCADFEAWTELGNNGWNSSDMESSFRKFQTHYPPDDEELAKRMRLEDCVDKDLDRSDGPLPITYLKGYGRVHQAWVDGFAELGFDTPGDPIHGKKSGAFTNPVSVDPVTHARGYSASAYYNSHVAARPNLRILTNTQVQRVILEEGDDGIFVAKGVEILADDGKITTIRVHEAGEVILSAGVVKSPQLLELSGVGNDELLRRHGIPVLVSNPRVGENLQDHPLSSVSFEVYDEQDSVDIMREEKNRVSAFQQYMSSGDGPLSGAHLSFAYLPLVGPDGRVQGTQIQDMITRQGDVQNGPEQLQNRILESLLMNEKEASGEYMLLPMQLNTNAAGQTTMSTLFTPRTAGNYITIVAMLNRPFSRGSVHIKSANPQDDPEIDPRYMSNPLDLQLLALHTQYLDTIVASAPMSTVLRENGRRIPEPCNLADIDTAKEAVVERCFTAFHPCGTCAMMPKQHGGVVSDRLAVYGTRGLRVVDASVFPMIPVGNIQATVYACAERAADIIKEDWRRGTKD